jgi:hypothetical protein
MLLEWGKPSAFVTAERADKRNLDRCRNLCIAPQVFNCGPKLVQLGAMLGLYY